MDRFWQGRIELAVPVNIDKYGVCHSIRKRGIFPQPVPGSCLMHGEQASVAQDLGGDGAVFFQGQRDISGKLQDRIVLVIDRENDFSFAVYDQPDLSDRNPGCALHVYPDIH